MLARRFTIVCLLIAIFGMVLATLVTEAARQKSPTRYVSQSACVFEHGNRCVTAQR